MKIRKCKTTNQNTLDRLFHISLWFLITAILPNLPMESVTKKFTFSSLKYYFSAFFTSAFNMDRTINERQSDHFSNSQTEQRNSCTFFPAQRMKARSSLSLEINRVHLFMTFIKFGSPRLLSELKEFHLYSNALFNVF